MASVKLDTKKYQEFDELVTDASIATKVRASALYDQYQLRGTTTCSKSLHKSGITKSKIRNLLITSKMT